MKTRTGIRVVLLSFVVASVGFLIVGEFRNDPEPEQPSASEPAKLTNDLSSSETHKIVVYYFYGNVRCASCRKIETFSREAVEGGFPGALKEGSIEWKLVNVDEPANKHFVKDYQLYTKSVVVSETRDGKEVRWKNLDRVWVLVRDKAAFVEYVRGEVASYMGEK